MQSEQHEIQTPRLILKSITPAIIHELFNTKTEEEIIHYFGIEPSGLEHYKSMHEKGMETHRISMFYFLLIDKETNQVIGDCGFHTWNPTHRRAELFYNLLNESDKRKGFMSEALKVVLEYGFTALNLHRIEALVADWNTPSLKLVAKNGFTKEGTMREDYIVNGVSENSECFSLLKWEWEKMEN